MKAFMSDSSDDDRESVDRALVSDFLSRRDEGSFVRLYRAHTPVLFRVAIRMTGAVSAAEDAVQEAWTRAIGGLPAFEWRSSLRTWLTSILMNCCRESRRREGAWVELSEDQSAHRGESGLRIDIERAIASLPDGYRSAVILHDVEGFTHEEISTMLGISTGTSKSQLFHARRMMRILLRSENGEAHG